MNPSTAAELSFHGDLQRGATGPDVRRIQEWISFHAPKGCELAVDGDFGPATERAVTQFQLIVAGTGRLPWHKPGIVCALTWDLLIEPLRTALRPIYVDGRPLRELLVAHAQQHWHQRPREIGGDNRGPWVRLYMRGADGAPMRWCAGFAIWLLHTAAQACDVAPPLPYLWGCDQLAGEARKAGRLFTPRSLADLREIKPGWLGLVAGSIANTYRHIYVVETVDPEAGTCTTIEGNTNDGGSANGTAVCRRIRGLAGHDYLTM